MPSSRFWHSFDSSASKRLALVGALSALLVPACASNSTDLTKDRCPVFGAILQDGQKTAYARGTGLQYRCRFARPVEVAAEPAPLPQVSAPPPVFLRRPAPRAMRPGSYGFDSIELDLEAKAELQAAATAVREHPDLQIVLVGHADSTGSELYNQNLSERRAEAAHSFLLDLGVSPSRIVASGRGEMEPATSNSTEIGRSLNRRLDIDVR